MIAFLGFVCDVRVATGHFDRVADLTRRNRKPLHGVLSADFGFSLTRYEKIKARGKKKKALPIARKGLLSFGTDDP